MIDSLKIVPGQQIIAYCNICGTLLVKGTETHISDTQVVTLMIGTVFLHQNIMHTHN